MSFRVFSIVVICFVMLFFFFKQKTAYEMRISDWSSDVCSSDLVHAGVLPCAALAVLLALAGSALYADRLERGFDARGHAMAEQLALGLSLSGDGAAPARLRSRSQPLFAQGFADRKSTRLNSSH